MSSSQQHGEAGGGGAPPMYFCHMCSIEIRPLMTPQPTCPRCNGGFVEEVDSSQDVREEEGITATANEQYWSNGPAGIHDQGPGLDIGSFMTTILRNLAAGGQDARGTTSSDTPNRSSSPQEPETDPLTGGTYTQNDQAGSSSSTNNGSRFRTGTTRLGPLNVTWGMGSHTMQGGSGIGGSGFSTFGTRRNPPDDHLEPVHDDGMGGAGGAADGRFFNHDNNNDNHGGRMPGSVPSSDEPDLPPELQSLREVFSNLFGGINDGPAGMLVDLFGNAFRGRSGDYVWGQQGLDDVISQLMEQTRGSTAPPPASDEAIAKLEKFSRREIEKVRQARNRECSTCMDSFEDEESAPAHDASKDSNLPTGIAPSSEMDVDDPPESAPGEGQQDELVMMPCKHLFHEDCLIPWLKNSGTCPVCRVSLEPKKATEDPSQTSTGSSAGPSSTTMFVPGTSGSAQLNTHPNRPISSTGIIQEREDTDVEDDDDIDDESPNQRRERMRRAAEARAHGGSSGAVPGSFPEPDDLD
ncbi:uncharacterized protein FA14DRAFT_159080 [Meira miltonrushii]|uniref:RING-type E3 ubiquitin transferase n=1 Tax=Meira miltonrushii TaxID=1280837 RepID=A0A316VGH7_9BASI|nr:uncharacterized protein FA14DRAFT_159080 [Meira miltonrushii]PWN36636.1 hypothetical protein FA14DRAFT_159080 [Meira miltonrushii]